MKLPERGLVASYKMAHLLAKRKKGHLTQNLLLHHQYPLWSVYTQRDRDLERSGRKRMVKTK